MDITKWNKEEIKQLVDVLMEDREEIKVMQTRIEELDSQMSLHNQLISTLGLLTIQTLAMFDDERKVNSILDKFNKALDAFVDDENVDVSTVTRDIKSAVTNHWENTDPKRRKSH
jgi:uncharacterized coiled-coil protein SlyX